MYFGDVGSDHVTAECGGAVVQEQPPARVCGVGDDGVAVEYSGTGLQVQPTAATPTSGIGGEGVTAERGFTVQQV